MVKVEGWKGFSCTPLTNVLIKTPVKPKAKDNAVSARSLDTKNSIAATGGDYTGYGVWTENASAECLRRRGGFADWEAVGENQGQRRQRLGSMRREKKDPKFQQPSFLRE